MKRRYADVLLWFLFSLFVLVVILFQTVVLGNLTILGTKLCLLPVAVAAVACQTNHEKAGFFALAVAVFWALLGEFSANAYILLLPVGALWGGWISTHYLTRGMGGTVLVGAGSVLLCEGGILLQRLYMGDPLPPDYLVVLATQVGISTLFAPVFWGLTATIERTVTRWKKS